MTKKDKKEVKVQTVTTEDGETVKVFEDLQGFETFIANETEDDDFDHLHCKLNYYPPFVLHESHEDPEKLVMLQILILRSSCVTCTSILKSIF